MYRFKTQREFIDEFGEDWKYKVENGWDGEMDYLFGREITYEDWSNIQSSSGFNKYWFGNTINHKWSISKDMVTDKPLPSTQPTSLQLADCHGYEFEAEYVGELIKGKITVEDWHGDRTRVFLCQNVRDGADCKNKQGFRFSYITPEGNTIESIKCTPFNNFKLLNKFNYVKEDSDTTEVSRPHSQGEPRGTIIAIHSEPISIARGSRFVGSTATNFYTGTTASKGKISYNRVQSIQDC